MIAWKQLEFGAANFGVSFDIRTVDFGSRPTPTSFGVDEDYDGDNLEEVAGTSPFS